MRKQYLHEQKHDYTGVTTIGISVYARQWQPRHNGSRQSEPVHVVDDSSARGGLVGIHYGIIRDQPNSRFHGRDIFPEIGLLS